MGDTATVDAAPQHLRALEQANRVRLARAELKRRVAMQQTSVVDVIVYLPLAGGEHGDQRPADEPAALGSRALPHGCCVSLGIPENKQIGTFTERQRSALVDGLVGAVLSQARPVPGRARVRARVPATSSRIAAAAVARPTAAPVLQAESQAEGSTRRTTLT